MDQVNADDFAEVEQINPFPSSVGMLDHNLTTLYQLKSLFCSESDEKRNRAVSFNGSDSEYMRRLVGSNLGFATG